MTEQEQDVLETAKRGAEVAVTEALKVAAERDRVVADLKAREVAHRKKLIEAGRRIVELEADMDDSDRLRRRLADLLTGTANALKGPPTELMLGHDWSDLPVVAAKLRDQVTLLGENLNRGVDGVRELVNAEAERHAKLFENVTRIAVPKIAPSAYIARTSPGDRWSASCGAPGEVKRHGLIVGASFATPGEAIEAMEKRIAEEEQ